MYTSWSLCSSRVCFRGVWLIAFGFRQTMVNFAMIHSSRVDRVISASRSDTNSKAMEMPSADLHFSGCFNKGRRRTECALFALAVPTLPRSTNVVERATAAAVAPPTIVKIVTLECHASLEGNSILSLNCTRARAFSITCSCDVEPFCWFGKESALLSLAMQWSGTA
jgi:hypothetical protein